MTKHFSIHFFSIAVCLALSNFQMFGNCHSVEKVDTIAKLKKYFNHLGYIPNSPSNFTNDFDDNLESAIKTYQKNFNLNVTGELDDQTLQHIERPRCGYPDVINGRNSKPTSAELNSTKLHTVAHFNFLGQIGVDFPAWNHFHLTYALIEDIFYPVGFEQCLVKAFKVWSDVSLFTFTLTPSSKSADIKISFYSGTDPKFNFYNQFLALSFAPQDGRLNINRDYNWSYDGKFTTAVTYDLETVMIHQIGHVLGLGHSTFPAAVMYNEALPWTRKDVLDNDDVEGIQSLYYSSNLSAPPKSSPPYWVSEVQPLQNYEWAAPPRSGGDYSARSCWGTGVLLTVAGFLFK